MRIHSTAESLANSEITLLAIVECAISIAIYAAIISYTGSFVPLAIAVILAPLFLLRTEYSVDLALEWWSNIFDWTLNRDSALIMAICIALMMPTAPLVRMCATAAGLIFQTKMTLSAIPTNWMRQTLCSDFFTVPEIIPGESKSEVVEVKFETLIGLAKEIPDAIASDKEEGILISWVLVSLLVLGYIPTILFRISFKATSVVYLALVWVARTSDLKEQTLVWRMERFTAGELERTRRYFSLFVLGLALAKIAFLGGLIERSVLDERFGSAALSSLFLSSWPWWNMTIVCDALLTYLIFYYSDWALSRVKANVGFNGRAAMHFLTTMVFMRGVIAILSVAGLFSLAVGVLAVHFGAPLAFLPGG